MTPKTVTYSSLLTQQECHQIATDVFAAERYEHSNEAVERRGFPISKTSFGVSNLLSAASFTERVAARCAKDYGPLVPAYHYARIYRTGAFLDCHADRPDSDVSLSVCVYTNAEPGWPLVISNIYHPPPWNVQQHPPREYFARDAVPYVMHAGDGVACLGSRFPHWRLPLQGTADTAVVQVFYWMSFAAK